MLKARGLYQEPVVEEPVEETPELDAEIEVAKELSPAIRDTRRPTMEPGKALRPDFAKKPIKK